MKGVILKANSCPGGHVAHILLRALQIIQQSNKSPQPGALEQLISDAPNSVYDILSKSWGKWV